MVNMMMIAFGVLQIIMKNNDSRRRMGQAPEYEKSIGEEDEKGEKGKKNSSHHLFHLLKIC